MPRYAAGRRRAVAVLLVAGGLLFGGGACESGDELGEEVGGERITGDGYSIEAPDGWYDAGETAADMDVETLDLAIAAEPSGDFVTNFNVVRIEPAPTRSVDQLERLLSREVEPIADGPIDPLERIDVDGSPAVGHELESSVGGEPHYLRQYSALHDGTVYTMTMSSGQDEADAAAATMEAIIASWTWETPTA